MTLDPNKVIAKLELGRISELNYVSRFHQNFGFEEGVFESLLAYKDLWADRLFYVPEAELLQWVSSGHYNTREIPPVSVKDLFPNYQMLALTEQEFIGGYESVKSIELTVIKSETEEKRTLSRGEQISLQPDLAREVIALHVGGRITAAKWSHNTIKLYLAVFVISGEKDLKSTISSPELSVFSGKPKPGQLLKSAILLYEYNPNSSSLIRIRSIDTSKFGATADLRWVPAYFGKDSIGVISAVFTDGSLHFFRIPLESTHSFQEATESSYMISCKNERLHATSELTPITAFDFIDYKRVIVGTLDGIIAEYIIPEMGASATEDLPDTPSFTQIIAEAAIKSITIGRAGDAHVLVCHTMGNQSYAVHYENLRTGRVEVDYSNSTVRPLFHDVLRALVLPDSAESLSLSFLRHPQLKASLLMKTELISSFHISEYLGHPFAIVGNILGEVFVMNVSRRLFALPKSQLKFLMPLKLWSLYKTAGSDGLTLNGNYELVVSDRNSVMYTFTPPEIVVSACAWNENLSGSSTYAFGTYSGLLVVERLDSNK